MYPRRLGASNPNCAELSYALAYPEQCTGSASSSGSGFDINNLINTILNDITQIIKPGTPQLRPVYTPTSTTTTSILSNPLVLVAGAALLFALVKRR